MGPGTGKPPASNMGGPGSVVRLQGLICQWDILGCSKFCFGKNLPIVGTLEKLAEASQYVTGTHLGTPIINVIPVGTLP